MRKFYNNHHLGGNGYNKPGYFNKGKKVQKDYQPINNFYQPTKKVQEVQKIENEVIKSILSNLNNGVFEDNIVDIYGCFVPKPQTIEDLVEILNILNKPLLNNYFNNLPGKDQNEILKQIKKELTINGIEGGIDPNKIIVFSNGLSRLSNINVNRTYNGGEPDSGEPNNSILSIFRSKLPYSAFIILILLYSLLTSFVVPKNIKDNDNETENTEGLPKNYPNPHNHPNIVKNVENKENRENNNDNIDFIKDNFLINGELVSNPSIEKTNVNNTKKYISYIMKFSHNFEGIDGLAKPESQEITVEIELSFDKNGFYIGIKGLKIGTHNIVVGDNSDIILNGVVYEVLYHNVNEKTKLCKLNIKPNIYKTYKYISEKIQRIEFENFSKIENTYIKLFKNIKLGKEVTPDGDNNFHREIFLIQDGKYFPISRIYFNTDGTINVQKTKERIASNPIYIFGVKISFTINLDKNGKLAFSIKEDTIAKIIAQIEKDKEEIRKFINNAALGSSDIFTGLNKDFNGGDPSVIIEKIFLVYPTINEGIYGVKRGNDSNQILYISVIKEGESSTIEIVDNNTFKQTNKVYYRLSNGNIVVIEIKDGNLILTVINPKKFNETEGLKNITFVGNNEEIKNIINNINNANTYYNENENTMYFFDKDGKLIIKIPCKYTKNGRKLSKVENQDINNHELYKILENENTEINILRMGLNMPAIDINEALGSLLKKAGININRNNNIIRVLENDKYVYLEINQKGDDFELKKIDSKKFEKVIKKLERKLKVLKYLEEMGTRMYQGKGYDFTDLQTSIAGSSGIGKYINQESIEKFLLGETNIIKIHLTFYQGGQIKTTEINIKVNEKGIDKGTLELKLKIDKKGENIVKIGEQQFIIVGNRLGLILYPINVK